MHAITHLIANCEMLQDFGNKEMSVPDMLFISNYVYFKIIDPDLYLFQINRNVINTKYISNR